MLQEQIQSMKNIKNSKTQKLIIFSDDINNIVKSHTYHSLQKQYFSVKQYYQQTKKKAQSQLKSLTKQIKKQQVYTQQLCYKLTIHDKKVDELKQIYYQMRRNNYELRCELQNERNQRNQRNGRNNVIYLSQSSSNSVIQVDDMTYEELLQWEDRLGRVNVGFKSKEISKLPVKAYKEVIQGNKFQNQEITCCVCCENIQKQHHVIKLSCSHIHHSHCISQWLKIKKFCPLCKQQVKINNIDKI